MGKYTVHLNAYACTSYTVEAGSPEEAYQLVMDEEASLDDCSASDWDQENPGEITCPDDTSVEINNLKDPEDIDLEDEIE